MAQRLNQSVVIMFTDIVGYSTLMESDEEATLNATKKIHEIQLSEIKKHNGIFVKESGDGMLAYFKDAELAINCAIEIHRAIRQQSELLIRIGLHYSEVYFESGDIYGDGVNIAARIEPLADPGGIYISQDLENCIANHSEIQCEFMGNAKLKNIRKPVKIFAIIDEDLTNPSKERFKRLANPSKKISIVSAVLVSITLSALAFFAVKQYFENQASEQEAIESLDEIEKLVEMNWRDYTEAFDLAKEVEKIIPKNERLKNLIQRSTVSININTEPEGATVYIRRYAEINKPWELIGTTPLDSVQLPITILRYKIELEGYETLIGAASTFDFENRYDMRMSNLYSPNDFFRKLDKKGQIPNNMSRVSGGEMPGGFIADFFIDKFEVTNLEYKKFMDAGGYENRNYWKEAFIKDGNEISWDSAMAIFVDKTGENGPSTWTNGNFPPLKENHPVSGVSWYEAKAYANFVNKDLPSSDHWGLARGENTFLIRVPQTGGYAVFAPFSNFNRKGSVEVGTMNGITPYGAYDMAGNVKEWCNNSTPFGKVMRGGDWNSNTYMFSALMQAPSFDRSETNGFRCAIYLDESLQQGQQNRIIIEQELEILEEAGLEMEPVSDEIFDVLKSFYSYDLQDLKSTVELKVEDRNWIHEKVTFETAYNNERMAAHLFLPKKFEQPYQTILYGPGAATQFQMDSDSITSYYEFQAFLEHFLDSGRAVVFPIIKGTFERRSDISISMLDKESQRYSDFMTQIIKDYRRTIDYLETRDEFDVSKLIFFGLSWGPNMGTLLSAVDSRIKTNLFVAGGLKAFGRPEVNQINFCKHVTIPTLLINGKYDSIFPFETSIEPFYKKLGSSEKDKKLIIAETDHLPDMKLVVHESNEWLNDLFGKPQ